MEVVELRTLDGPNLFMLRPAIKLEIAAGPDSRPSDAAFALLSEHDPDRRRSQAGPVAAAHVLKAVLLALHQRLGVERDGIVVREMEEAGHVVVAFPWSRRAASKALGRLAWQIVAGEPVDVDDEMSRIRELLDQPADADDVPEMLRESERTTPIIGITGTNGKTTTTRLASAILRNSGKRVGWTSSSGVMIDDVMVLPGDYTGPSGAQRVFEEPDVDVAVLETARGGILLRGLGYEHNDVSVMTNISADHMGMHGVHSLDVLTEVKSVVARVTTSDGYAVLNADDPRVLNVREVIAANPILFSRSSSNHELDRHVEQAGWALRVVDGEMVWYHDGESEIVALLDDVPITFGGRAEHMVENALAAAAACLALGVSVEDVRNGLKAFRNRAEENRGRLNVFERDGATVVVDFAHNEAGLEHLLRFARTTCAKDGRLTVAIGTAGDREDSAIEGIGRIAAEHADAVIIKDSEKYLRGREAGEMPRMLKRVVGDLAIQVSPNERTAFYRGLELIKAGDTLAVMCIEDSDEILGYLEEHARPVS